MSDYDEDAVYSPSDDELVELYGRIKTIAVVGASDDEAKAATASRGT